MDFERRKTSQKEVSMIPLINLVFLLLIFFLVAGNIEKFDIISIELPFADSGKVLDEGHIVVVLGRNEEIIINDELTDYASLEQELRARLEINPNQIISLKSDSYLDAAKLIRVMDTIRASGGDYVSLVTQSTE